MKSFFAVFFCALILFFTACKDSENPAPRGQYGKGFFVVNEGNSAVSGSISFWDSDSNKIFNDIYNKENSPLVQGFYTQSMYLHQGKAYICVDNGDKVIVVDNQTFKQTQEIKLKVPNSMVAEGNIGYVTEWINNDSENPTKGQVSFIDLQTGSVTASVTTDGAFPKKLVLLNNRLYVLNSLDSTMAILNTQTKSFEKKIKIGSSPSGIVVDKNNDLWIIVSGKPDYSGYPIVVTLEAGKLLHFSVNGTTLDLKHSFSFPEFSGDRLIINSTKDKLYYTYNGKVYEQSISSPTLNTTPLLSRDFYGIGIDPSGSTFYGADAGNFASNGKVIRYNLATKAALDSITVGIAPNGFLFR